MGRKLVLHGTKLTDTSAPILPGIDVILPAAGALVFIDPTHPYRPWAAGVPTTATPTVNLAEDQAMATTGLTAAQVTPVMHISSNFISGGNRLERSTKGGLHFMMSQSAADATNQFAAVDYYESRNGERALGQWLQANKAHSFYAAKWGRWTRPVGAGLTSGGWQHSRIATSNQFISFYARSASAGESVYPTDATRVGYERVNQLSTTAAPHFIDGAVSTGAAATSITFQPIYSSRAALGANNGIYAPSEVVYGYYLEDLTVSGRTYAQVNALVKAKYTADVLTPGGRYHGDTYTDPTTLA